VGSIDGNEMGANDNDGTNDKDGSDDGSDDLDGSDDMDGDVDGRNDEQPFPNLTSPDLKSNSDPPS